MKLTNRQLSSLTNKIYLEIKEQKNAARKLAIETWKQENQQLIEDTLHLYNSVIQLLETEVVYSIRLEDYGKEIQTSEALIETITFDIVKDNIDLGEFMFPISEKQKINQEIVLATIECDNLQELIDSVKSKF